MQKSYLLIVSYIKTETFNLIIDMSGDSEQSKEDCRTQETRDLDMFGDPPQIYFPQHSMSQGESNQERKIDQSSSSLKPRSQLHPSANNSAIPRINQNITKKYLSGYRKNSFISILNELSCSKRLIQKIKNIVQKNQIKSTLPTMLYFFKNNLQIPITKLQDYMNRAESKIKKRENDLNIMSENFYAAINCLNENDLSSMVKTYWRNNNRLKQGLIRAAQIYEQLIEAL